jgi:hypothetical protein
MATFEKIATVDVGLLGAASIDFSVIPTTFTDLCVKLSARGTSASVSTSIYISFNGSTASFTGKWLEGAGSGTPGSGSIARYIGDMTAATATASTFSNQEVYIPNYASSNNKSFSADSVTENNATLSYIHLNAGLWSNTAVINQVTLTPAAGTFVQYSTATLYGIKKA